MPSIDYSALNESGLNIQAVFDLSELPDLLSAQLSAFHDYKRLFLIGHGGRRMWEALQASGFRDRTDPVDSFSVDVVRCWMAEACPGAKYEIIYPSPSRVVPLQQLGKLAGWHHDSPFRIGINREWGSWFAYRVAVLIDVELPTTGPQTWSSPCEECLEKPCIAVCPAGAVSDRERMLERCIGYRLQEHSRCARQCLSRLACPVAAEHRYSTEQICYHYGQSLQTIRRWRQGKA